MLRLTCPSCRSKLTAKEELAGQTRKCPKCGTTVFITATATELPPDFEDEVAVAEVAPDQRVHGLAEDKLPDIAAPHRLVRLNRYLVCDNSKVFAAWENNGQGWMLTTTAGFISAVRNNEKLPSQGDFKLVELKMTIVDDALRLDGITVYQLARRWAMTTLNQGDDRLLTTVIGAGWLQKEQKTAIRQHIREHYMRNVWENADAVMDYLSNTDYHSPGVAGGAEGAIRLTSPDPDQPG